MSDWVDVANVNAFPAGEVRLLDVDDVPIAIVNAQGEYYALEDVCTHDGSPLLGCALAPEEVIEGATLICPRHGARFCMKTGAALSPPAYEPIAIFPTRVDNGVLQVRDDRQD